jgi:hypothetical protein
MNKIILYIFISLLYIEAYAQETPLCQLGSTEIPFVVPEIVQCFYCKTGAGNYTSTRFTTSCDSSALIDSSTYCKNFDMAIMHFKIYPADPMNAHEPLNEWSAFISECIDQSDIGNECILSVLHFDGVGGSKTAEINYAHKIAATHNIAEDTAIIALKNAINTWNYHFEIPPFQYSSSNAGDALRTVEEGKFDVIWGWGRTGINSSLPAYIAACTEILIDMTNGKVVGAKIHLAEKQVGNIPLQKFGYPNPAEDEIDLQGILTHEIGHLLGLWDAEAKSKIWDCAIASGTNSIPTMGTDYRLKSNNATMELRTLHEYDLITLRLIYHFCDSRKLFLNYRQFASMAK